MIEAIASLSSPLSAPQTGIGEMQAAFSLIVVSALGVFALVSYVLAAAKDRKDSDLEALNKKAKDAALLASINDGSYRIPPEKARGVMVDLFGVPAMRPLGVPSTERDVERQREWRERRALNGSDHHRYHFAEGAVPSEWATEVLMLTVGTGEVER